MSEPRRVAMGDPQAPLERVQAVLDHQGLLEGGRLRAGVQLTSMGDHFDWGKATERERAGNDGFELLTWLASHPPEQVQLVIGNHDLARVGELAGFDDRSFASAYAEAAPIYARDDEDATAERELLRRWPQIPSAECVARDFATFQVRQRELVAELLRTRRLRIAFAAAPSVVLLHAGVTRDELGPLGLSPAQQRDAFQVAAALNGALDRALDGWAGGPLAIPGLHQPGSASAGEGRGIFYHRPELAERGRPEHFVGPPRRRFDPRRLPTGLTQVVGHIRDNKCQTLLDSWSEGPKAGDGPLRSLVVTGAEGRYRKGVAPSDSRESARMIFTDGGMAHASVEGYELLDLSVL